MPNVTYTSAQAFIPEAWATRAFQVLRENIVLAKLVTTDSDVGGNFAAVGDILHIPFPGTFTATAKTANTAVTLQTPTDTDVTVTLNKHYEVSFLIEDIARAMQNQQIMDRYLRNAVVPLAKQLENDLWALYASLTNSVTSASFTGAQLLAAMKQLDTQLVPSANRICVISPGARVKLLGDTTLQSFFAFSDPQAVRQGNVGRAYGFDIYMSQLVPASTNMRNLAFDPEVFILATRPLPETDNPGVSQLNFTDPESNITFRQTVAYNASQLGVQITLDVLYGVAVLRNAAGCVVNSTLGEG